MGNMFSVSISCDNAISRCWDCVAGEALYSWHLQENLGSLKLALNELRERRNDVLMRVNVAEQAQNMKRLDQVQGWLSRADTMIHDVDQLLLDHIGEINIIINNGCSFINKCKSNHKFGKRVAKRLRQVGDLMNKGAFEEGVAIPLPLPATVERPTDPAVGIESVFNKVKSSIGDKDVGIIGIYGKGGVGKTRLMTEINNNIGHQFDLVIWVVVSRGFYLEKVQDDIAKRIGLFVKMWSEKTPEEKATELFRNLRRKKFALLLDDVWERVDLSKVGVPSPTQGNGSKLIFTTRSLDVCGKMGAHKKIQVACLVANKAWELFEQYVGKDILITSHPEIPELARDVAKECGGLPLALITIGRAMACKTKPEEWKYSLDVLRQSANFVFPDMGEEVYPLLKFSYDNLSNDILRLCLLYCSLFSEDFQIRKEVLIDCWIGEGIFDEDHHHDNDNIVTTHQSRNQGHHIIGILVHACLLEEVNDDEIKMHDVIRDMCLWIACKCEADKWKFFVEAGYGLTKVPHVERWRSIQRMSLMQNKIPSLTGSPDCPHLQTLFLNLNHDLEVIQSDFFQFMRGLKVLSLRDNLGVTEVPVGISNLESLQYLDLSGTGIKHLPIELKGLEKLKCLDLERIGSWIAIPRGLIAGFSKLQILRMYQTFVFDEQVKENNECLAEELQCLEHLNLLRVSLTSDFGLNRFLSAQRLHGCAELISLNFFGETKQLNILPFANFKRLNNLELHNCQILEDQVEISASLSQPCFQSLSHVHIAECWNLRDITWLILAPNLRSVIVVRCRQLEEIINEIKQVRVADTLSPFAKLKNLSLVNLTQLKSIYPSALPFPCMNRIEVYNCPKLRRLPLNSNSTAKGNKIIISGERQWWNELQWEDNSTREAFLPCFVASKY